MRTLLRQRRVPLTDKRKKVDLKSETYGKSLQRKHYVDHFYVPMTSSFQNSTSLILWFKIYRSSPRDQTTFC